MSGSGGTATSENKIKMLGEFNMQKIRKAVIPAAGYGTRFLPATKATPKEMLPIVPDDKVSSYGIVAGDATEDPRLMRVRDMIEKPSLEEAPSRMAVLGRYIIRPEIFGILEHTAPGKGGEIQLTDALKELARQQAVYAYDFEGERYDLGDKLGFLKATVEFALRREDLGAPFKKYLKDLVARI